MSSLRVAAYAKINLSLEVLGRRADGFHEVISVMRCVSLCDELTFSAADSIELECSDPALLSEGNLAVRAARALREVSGKPLGASISLVKRIPVASGLGGASSDAAATLRGLNALWDLGLPSEELSRIGGQIGSDVPFFLQGGTSIVSGRGEIVTALPDSPEVWLVLVVVPHDLRDKTRQLYGMLKPDSWSSGEITRELAGRLSAGAPPEERLLVNCFERVAHDAFSALPEHRSALIAAGARGAHLSGAGPTIFTIAPGEGQARVIADDVSLSGCRALVARTLSRRESVPTFSVL